MVEVESRRRQREPWECITLADLGADGCFDALVRASYARMLALARQYADTPEDADDAVQQAFLELFDAVSSSPDAPAALAVGFLVNRVRWRARDASRARRRLPPARAARPQQSRDGGPAPDGDGAAPEPADTAPDPAALLIAIQKSEDLHRIGRTLSGRRLQVFERLAQDMRPADIARELEISRPRVTQLVQIICLQLREALRAHGWECSETVGISLNCRRGRTLEE